ncbi:alkaline phosphatase family protein [Halogeometricum borinquense]|uniref:alkaline phosphatase family protein n=1 Tax=Halogeometricum borinquense TaxID=60847 RepID=UPI001A91B69A|nr:alkaline phosphatase family protein [Halogeometricum borinquense]
MLKNEDDDSAGGSVLERIVHVVGDSLSVVGLSPKQIHQALARVKLAKPVERILPTSALIGAISQVVDRPNSTAYQFYFNSLGIHLNVSGRDPNGVVSKEEYDEVRSELIDDLQTIRDPDGKKVFEAVLPKEDVYEGEHLEDAPDILLIPRDYRYDVSGSLLNTFRRYQHKNHKPEGILLTNQSLQNQEDAQIYDVAPTLAAEMGLPIDSLTDGSILTDAADEVIQENWDTLTEGYNNARDSGDTSSVEDRLANLGYME